MDETELQRLAALDHAHLWHPFTPMQQWRESEPLIVEAAENEFLIDGRGHRYIDGIASLWANVHGHRVPHIDEAVRGQLDRVAHTTLLGLSNVPAVELATRLCQLAPGSLNKVFFSDAGATATELGLKMAVGSWYHEGQPQRDTFLALEGAYHGDTTGSMSVGYDPTAHRPFDAMVFRTETVPAPDTFHRAENTPADAADGRPRRWSLEDPDHCESFRRWALAELDKRLTEMGDRCAGVVVEPLVQGAAGMVMQPPGYLRGVAQLARKHGVLLLADEVATGFGRTGTMFACEQEGVEPDILCLGKGLSGGYLPLAATICTDAVAGCFEGPLHEHRTLYHGHTYTGNPLASAAALASLDLFERNNLLEEVGYKASVLREALAPLRDPKRFPHVGDVRQRGLMVGVELVPETGETGTGFDPTRRLGHEVCAAARRKGVIVRPLGNVVILMPPLAIREENLRRLADAVVECTAEHVP